MDQTGQIDISLDFGFFDGVGVMQVLTLFQKNFLKGELQIEYDISDRLGHSSKVVIDEGENGRG